MSGKSLNAWVVEKLQAAVAHIKSMKTAKTEGKRKRKSHRAEKHA
jgi:RPA family protein